MTIQNVWRGISGGEAGDGGNGGNGSSGKQKSTWWWWGGGSYGSNGGNGGNGGSTLLKITDSIVTINGVDSDVSYGFGGDAGSGKKAGKAGKDGTSVATFIGELNDVVALGGGFRGKVIIDAGSLFVSAYEFVDPRSRTAAGTAEFVDSGGNTVYPMTFRVVECPGLDPVIKLAGVRIESGTYVAYSRTSERLSSPEQATFGWATVWLPTTSDFVFSLDKYESTELKGVLINSEQTVMLCPLGTVTFYAEPGAIQTPSAEVTTYDMHASHGKSFADPFDGVNLILNAPIGMSFVGWFEKIDNGYAANPWDFTTGVLPHGNLKLYAVYESSSADYQVTWYNTDNTVLKQTETRPGTTGSTVSVEDADKTIFGYTFDSTHANNVLFGTVLGDGSLELKLYFTANTDVRYTVNYLEEGTNAVLSPAKTETGTFNAEYTEDAIAITGYSVVGLASQTFSLNEYEKQITFYYTANTNVSYTVNYLEQGTDAVLSTAKTETGTFNAEYTEDAIGITGYTVVDPASQTFFLDAYGKQITFYYTADEVSYTVQYMPGVGVGNVHTFENVLGEHRISECAPINIGKDGYDLHCWMIHPVEKAELGRCHPGDLINVDCNIMLTAMWQANYTVTWYDVGTGQPFDGPVTRSVYDNDVPAVLGGDKIRAGWTFIEDYPGNVLSGTIPTDGTTLELKLYFEAESQEVTVTYKPGTGRGTEFTDNTVTGSYTLIGYEDLEFAPADGCSFKHWMEEESLTIYSNEEVIDLTESLVLVAIWDTDCYSVNYYSGMHGEGHYNDKSMIPETPYRILTLGATGIVNTDPDNYKFGAWKDRFGVIYNESETVTFTSSMDLQAQWMPVGGFTVTYYAGDNGTGGPTTFNTAVYNEDHNVRLPAEVGITPDSGAVFTYWSDGKGNTYDGTEVIQVTENISLTMMCHNIDPCFVINYFPGDLKQVPKGVDVKRDGTHMVYDYEDPHLEFNPLTEGYNFVYWTEKGVGGIYRIGDQIKNVNRNMSLTPVWGEYTVTYLNENGGTAKVDWTPATDAYQVLDQTQVGLENEFFYVQSWSDGTEKEYIPGFTVSINENVTLSPVWDSVCHRVYYFNDISVAEQFEDGVRKSEYANKTVYQLDHGDVYTVLGQTDADVYKQGASFSHWVDQDENVIPAGDTITIDKIETYLFAVWDEEPVDDIEVTFDAGNGMFTGISNARYITTVTPGDKLTLPEEPVLTGASFMGWVTEDGVIWDFDNIVQEPDFILDARWDFGVGESVTVTFNIEEEEDGGYFIQDNVADIKQIYSVYVSMGETVSEPVESDSSTPIGYVAPKDAISVTWRTENGGIWNFEQDLVTQTMTLTAVWEYEEVKEEEQKKLEEEQKKLEEEQKKKEEEKKKLEEERKKREEDKREIKGGKGTGSASTSNPSPEITDEPSEEENSNEGFAQDLPARNGEEMGFIKRLFYRIMSWFN